MSNSSSSRWATLIRLKDALNIKGLGFATAAGGASVGADLTGVFEGKIYLLLILSIIALLFIYYKVTQKVNTGDVVSDEWQYAFLATAGAGLASLIIMIIGWTQDDDLEKKHPSILRNLVEIRQDTKATRSDARQTNLLLEAESIGQKLYAEVDESKSTSSVIRGKLKWPPGLSFEPDKCEAIQADGLKEILYVIEMDGCDKFSVIIDESKLSNDFVELSAQIGRSLSSSSFFNMYAVSVETKSGETVHIPLYHVFKVGQDALASRLSASDKGSLNGLKSLTEKMEKQAEELRQMEDENQKNQKDRWFTGGEK